MGILLGYLIGNLSLIAMRFISGVWPIESGQALLTIACGYYTITRHRCLGCKAMVYGQQGEVNVSSLITWRIPTLEEQTSTTWWIAAGWWWMTLAARWRSHEGRNEEERDSGGGDGRVQEAAVRKPSRGIQEKLEAGLSPFSSSRIIWCARNIYLKPSYLKDISPSLPLTTACWWKKTHTYI